MTCDYQYKTIKIFVYRFSCLSINHLGLCVDSSDNILQKDGNSKEIHKYANFDLPTAWCIYWQVAL